jgi:very-short-patch-repair endonuclease
MIIDFPTLKIRGGKGEGFTFYIPHFSKGGEGGITKLMLFYNTKLKQISRKLRSDMTDAEKFLWSSLRSKQLKGYQFYRQRIIGDYIVDFYCPKASLIIELDGGQHYTEEGIKKDFERDNYLRGQGYKVIRFSDRDVFENLNGVIERIYGDL